MQVKYIDADGTSGTVKHIDRDENWGPPDYIWTGELYKYTGRIQDGAYIYSWEGCHNAEY